MSTADRMPKYCLEKVMTMDDGSTEKSEYCHNELPCPVHGPGIPAPTKMFALENKGDNQITGPIDLTEPQNLISVDYFEYQDSRPESYYAIQMHCCRHTLTPERALELWYLLENKLMAMGDLRRDWRGHVVSARKIL